MQQLSSKNFEAVLVTIRDYDQPVKLDVQRGVKLMDYLTTGQAGSHIKITLEDGTPIVVKTSDIYKVEPVQKLKGVKDYV